MTEESFAEGLRLEPLASLRSQRTALREEERQVSYWRRLVQGRLDLVRSALAGDDPVPPSSPPARPSRSGRTTAARPPSAGSPTAAWTGG